MKITGTTTPPPLVGLSATDDRTHGDPDGYYVFDATPLQLKTLLERGSVQPDDEINFVLIWDQPGFEETEDGVIGPGPREGERVPGVIRANIVSDLADRLGGGARQTHDTVDATAMMADAEDVVRELADTAVADRYEEVEEARIVGIQAARPAQSEPPPPPEQVPEAQPDPGNAALRGPTKALMIGGAGAVAWLIWKNMSLS